METEEIKQLANDVNNVVRATAKPYQEKMRQLEVENKVLRKALDYAETFIDGYGEARLKENLGRDGMDAVLREIDKITKDIEPNLCICCEEIAEENAHLHRNCGK